MLRIVSVLALSTLCTGALAQPVFKCTEDGKVSYGQAPCSSGKTTELDAPAAAGSGDGGHELLRQKALLAKLIKEREAVEKADALAQRAAARQDARSATNAAARRQRCDKLRLQKKWLDEDLARTAGPATEPLKLKVRRQAEAMAVQCPV
jgi:hypothetical protein